MRQKIRNKIFSNVEYGATSFQRLFEIASRRVARIFHENDASRFAFSPRYRAAPKFALHIFFPLLGESLAVRSSIRPISLNCRKYRTWLTAYIADTNESARGPNHENSKSNTTLGADTCHYFRRKEQNGRMQCRSCSDGQRWGAFNDSDRSAAR